MADDDSDGGGGGDYDGGDAWEALARVEHGVACSSEKALNMEMLLIKIEDVAGDYAALSADGEGLSSEEVAAKAFEFDSLSAILSSEVRELDDFVASLRSTVRDAGRRVLDGADSVHVSGEVEKKVRECEDSLERTRDVVADVRKHSAKFESDLAFAGLGARTDASGVGSENISPRSPAVAREKKLAEQQRSFLQMLEKSLARELDLEEKLVEARHTEDELKLKLHYAERTRYSLEESMEAILHRAYEAENAAEIFRGISKELAGKLLSAQQSSLKDSDEESSEVLSLRDQVSSLEEKLKESDGQLQMAKATAEANQEQQSRLLDELQKMENEIKDLKEDISRLESRAASAEEKCGQQTKTNTELDEQLRFSASGEEKADLLERKFKESNAQLEHTKASLEAMEENQTMLYSALGDMENLIQDLKGKVTKAEGRAESAENKCILLTDTNLELNEELGFLRSRLESMQSTLNQVEDARITTAKDIGIRTKLITDLVIKLAMEREHLQLQISSLTKRNRHLADQKLQKKDSSLNKGDQKDTDGEINSSTLESSQEVPTESAVKNVQANESATATRRSVTGAASTRQDPPAAESTPETVRTIEATQLNFKYLVLAAVVLLVSISAVYLFQLET